MFNTSNNNTTITNNFSSSEDKMIEQRRFMCQKAIEAYQYHVNRYHTWMNYYALFNGALLVAFCTLLCATTQIAGGKGSVETEKIVLEGGTVILSNNYGWLQVLIIVLGILTSFLWLLSILGHRTWTLSWMSIICKYEREYGFDPLYRMVILQNKYNPKNKDGASLEDSFKRTYIPEGFSTDKLTIKFVWLVIISWYVTLLYLCFQNFVIWWIFVFIVFFSIVIYFLIRPKRHCKCKIWDKFLYTNVRNKKREYEY
ncbi:MAG: hypothetical protein KH058_13865 [Bacteroides sp.]|nr:hypothetical protein [Bacteroides sp.]MBS4826674.1 hypothetical protein [Bacteroides sp.]